MAIHNGEHGLFPVLHEVTQAFDKFVCVKSSRVKVVPKAPFVGQRGYRIDGLPLAAGFNNGRLTFAPPGPL